MCERVTIRRLLTQARELYDSKDEYLETKARSYRRDGINGGAVWMRDVLTILRRGQIPRGQTNFFWLAIVKYGLSFLFFAIAIIALGIWAGLIAGIFLFYVVEAQMVFLFPSALDGATRPFIESRARTVQAGGTLHVMRVVFGLGMVMIGGSLFGYGFLRSWCLGCLAILIWYEELRKNGTQTTSRFKLEICASNPIHIRHEKVILGGLAVLYRILYASDLHFSGSFTSKVASQLVEAVDAARPNRVVLGGDLLDSQQGTTQLARLVQQVTKICPVVAIAGNHDRFVGIDFVRSTVQNAGGTWHGDVAHISVTNADLHVVTNVICVHNPAIFDTDVVESAQIVLAGHLHGGQLVIVERENGLFPGNLFNRWNRLRVERNGKIMLVSRGVNDTLPIRWNCPREVILCEIY